MSQSKPQIVHESEAQRQYVRVEFPSAKVVLNGNPYPVKDISVGGVRIHGITSDQQIGDTVALDIILPFEAFSLTLSLPAAIEHIDKHNKTMGCAFSSLTEAQMSLLNIVIKSRMAGTIIDAGDLLHIAGRSNVIKLNQQNDEYELTGAQKFKRNSIFAAFAVIGLLCLTLIAGNLYERINIIRTAQAFVSADSIVVRSPEYGEFQSMLGNSITSVRTGQTLGQVKVFATDEQTRRLNQITYPVMSPCDCTILDAHTQTGTFPAAGDALFTLLPEGAAPHITAHVPLSDAQKITAGSSVTFTIAGQDGRFNGKVDTINVAQGDTLTARIRITPETPLPHAIINAPVSVEIKVQ